ncbi:siderophore-interacting protein [Cryobacterium sp. CG_9.6]|uniref:siderophore-interacting protein n=1 Tax=Cryobacterium sp. CG_9.6 TaxID=2760710 RepID=UPI0024759411|nr:siderophore-interacting protein [Cryobacterium sp. CG_9.6]MDH6237745.1 NADPH-dependent ferric siderophore reductase [Cryobacterium sp. CG_9.6]
MLTSLASTTVVERMPDDRPAYRPYAASVAGIRRLGEHSVRVTFAGADFDTFGTAGLDQRIKIVFPLPGIGVSEIGATDQATIDEGTWYSRWRALPDAVRNPFRTYTIRAARPEVREIDVDFVAHDNTTGHAGPAARWLSGVALGDTLVIVGPDARSAQAATGFDWHPGCATVLLLAGDETAAPAICAILESLPATSRAHAFLEVVGTPDATDAATRSLSPGCQITWLPRGTAPQGVLLDAAVRAWVAGNRDSITVLPTAQVLEDIDVDRDLLWESPAAAPDSDFYAWLAGEASVIKKLRRFLVSETGIDRTRVAFMGYWRHGRAEAQ